MCRLAAFPPGFNRKDALNILANFECANTDGTGFTFVKNGEFVTAKWPKAFTKLYKGGKSILTNMPHKGWTIAHLRAASHGGNTKENTHPFIIGDWAICHNGIWSDYEVAKLALDKYVKFHGETDSEVAGHLINNLGPKKFATAIEGGGVFLALHRDGSLWVMKTSGDLVMTNMPDKTTLIASELDQEKWPAQAEAFDGWYHFDKEGKHADCKKVIPWYLKDLPPSWARHATAAAREVRREGSGSELERGGSMPGLHGHWMDYHYD